MSNTAMTRMINDVALMLIEHGHDPRGDADCDRGVQAYIEANIHTLSRNDLNNLAASQVLELAEVMAVLPGWPGA